MADNPYAKYTNPYAGYVPVGVPDPTKPLDLQAKRLGIQKDQSELALTPYQLQKQKAEAGAAELDLKTKQEAYAAAHPQGSNATVLGPDSLKKLSPPDQEIVKALAEGRLAFPGGFALKAPWWQQKLEQVAAYDPTFDATNFNNRAKARAMLLTGKVGTSANALNTAIGHAGLLNQQISGTASHSGMFGLATTVNSLINAYEKGAGDPGITNFKDTAGKLASELTSVYRNGGGAEQDVIRQLQSLDPNASQAQKEQVIRNTLDLLASKQAANLYQYGIGSGGKPPVDLLDPDARKVLDQFPDIRDKHFNQSDQPISAAAAAMLQHNGGAPPPGAPPASLPGSEGPPPVGGGGVPRADYSDMVGGPQSSLAVSDPNSKLGAFQQTYRNEYDPVMANTLSTFIKKGAPYDTAAQFAQSHGFNAPDPQTYSAAVAFAKAHGGATNVEANKAVPTTLGERLASSPLAAGVAAAGSSGTAGLLDTGVRSLVGPSYDANRAALAATNPTSDLVGNVAGGAAGMFAGGSVAGGLLRAGAKGGLARNALALALKNPGVTGAIGDTAYGAMYGANENPDNPLAGAGVGALAGLGGGAIGNVAAKGAGAVLQGVTNPAVQRLRQAGIPLTAGEVLGGGFKKGQDAMTSVFGPGNMVAKRYADGREALNKAAFNQAGDIIGAPINSVGQAGIQALDTAKTGAYSNALDPITLDLNTPKFLRDFKGARLAAQGIPNVDQASELATGSLDNYIGTPGLATGGVMNGQDFQQAYRGLSRVGKQSSNRIYGHEIGQALGQGQDALVSALQTQNPGAFDAFLKANAANRHLSVLSKAVDAAKSQVGEGGEPLFTPAQLGTAASANARTYSGQVAAASGNRPFNQLALDSQQVMSSKLPESGTFPRQLMGLAMTGGLSGAGGMFGGRADGAQGAAGGAAIPLGLLTLLGTRRGQKFLTGALLNRTLADQYTGRLLARSPQIGGNVLTAGAVPLIQGP